MKKGQRKMARGEQWTKKCPSCTERWRKLLSANLYSNRAGRGGMGGPEHAEEYASFIPDDYEICNDCLGDEYELDTEYDALDHLGLVQLCTKDLAIRAIRWANGETYVKP